MSNYKKVLQNDTNNINKFVLIETEILSIYLNLTIIITMDLLTEGQKLTLYFKKDKNLVEMSCTIEKVRDDRLDLILPQYFMRYIQFLQVGKKLTAKVFTKLGTIDFNTVVILSPLEDTFTIEMDYNSMKLNPGEKIPVVNAIEWLDFRYNDEILNLKTFELSTEHVKFYCDKKISLNTTVDASLNLPKDYGIIKFKGIIIEEDPVYENEYKMIYTTMTEQDKQSLLYYMYMYSKETDWES